MTYVTYGTTELQHLMSEIEDLEEAKRALIRETVVRQMMTETGESREIVIEMINAMESMNQEAVLNLTEGEPTTLADALSRYVETLEDEGEGTETPKTLIAEDLSALLAYPWPDSVIPPNANLEVVDYQEGTVSHHDYGWDEIVAAEKMAAAKSWLRRMYVAEEQLDRIKTWHSREAGPSGMVGDFCTECGEKWPCDTRQMAEGTYKDQCASDDTDLTPYR